MHQAEAMWINFCSGYEYPLDYPFAVKVATGKVCALTGDAWVNHLNRDPQHYVVVPEQPWLDGYCVEKGIVRHFVGMPLTDAVTLLGSDSIPPQGLGSVPPCTVSVFVHEPKGGLTVRVSLFGSETKPFKYLGIVSWYALA